MSSVNDNGQMGEARNWDLDDQFSSSELPTMGWVWLSSALQLLAFLFDFIIQMASLLEIL